MSNLTELIKDAVSIHIDLGKNGRDDLRDDPAAYYADIIINELSTEEKRNLAAELLNEQKIIDKLDFIVQSEHDQRITELFTDYLKSRRDIKKMITFVDYLEKLAYQYHTEIILELITDQVGSWLRNRAKNESRKVTLGASTYKLN